MLQRLFPTFTRLPPGPVYHRDIKPTNIMLDENYRAKVADFGTSKMIDVDHTHVLTVVSGTIGYVDPEYFQSGRLTEKNDVYSYVIVLVELITGEKPMIPFQRLQKNLSLTNYFLVALKENRLSHVINPRIKDHCKLDQVTAMAEIVRMCLDIKGENRPKMSEVSMELDRICSSRPKAPTMRNDEKAQVYRRSQSLNLDIASTSRAEHDSELVRLILSLCFS